MTALKILLLLSMFYIVYEDFRFRAIRLFSLLVFLGAALSYSLLSLGLNVAISQFLFNFLLILFQLSLVFLYLTFRKKNWKIIVNSYLGIGDLFFYVPVLFLFSPLNFICIHILALVLVLAGFALFKVLKMPVKTIPLAGGLSLVMSLALLASWFISPGVFYDDLFISDLIYSFKY